jgi:hypothetical protein
MGSICLENFFPAFDFKPVFIYLFFGETNLLPATYGWVLFFNLICYSMSFDWGIEAIYIQY